MNLGPMEVVVILVVALLVLGPDKLPEIGRQVGKAVREFRRFQSSFQNEFRDILDDAPPGPMGPSPDPASHRGAGSPPRADADEQSQPPSGPGGDAAPAGTAVPLVGSAPPSPGPTIPLRPEGEGDEHHGHDAATGNEPTDTSPSRRPQGVGDQREGHAQG